MLRCATVYRRKQRFLVHSSSRTTDGVWILGPPYLVVAEGDDHALERAIQSALEGSRADVPHPRTFEGLQDPLLALAGVKNWKAFSKGAECVEVADDGDHIALTPTKNRGPQGFEHDVARRVLLARNTTELGVTTRRMLGADA